MSGWTGQLAEIAEVVGGEATERLVETYRGRRLYVPRTVAPDHPIVTALGAEAADLLVERYGGDAIEVPLGRQTARSRLSEQIARATGSDRQVAGRLGCSRALVRKVRGKRPAAPVGGTGAP